MKNIVPSWILGPPFQTAPYSPYGLPTIKPQPHRYYIGRIKEKIDIGRIKEKIDQFEILLYCIIFSDDYLVVTVVKIALSKDVQRYWTLSDGV